MIVERRRRIIIIINRQKKSCFLPPRRVFLPKRTIRLLFLNRFMYKCYQSGFCIHFRLMHICGYSSSFSYIPKCSSFFFLLLLSSKEIWTCIYWFSLNRKERLKNALKTKRKKCIKMYVHQNVGFNQYIIIIIFCSFENGFLFSLSCMM